MSNLSILLVSLGLVAQSSLLALPVALVVLSYSGRSVRIRATRERVVLTAVDGRATLVALGLLGLVSLGAVLWARSGALSGWLLGLSLLTLLALSFRVEVVVTARAARLERRALGWICWRRMPLERPTAWVDGWGDLADPLAFFVGDEARAAWLEVGFIDAGNQRTEPLAAAFREAVRSLRSASASRET